MPLPTPPYLAAVVAQQARKPGLVLTDPWSRWVNGLTSFINNGGIGTPGQVAVDTVDTTASRDLTATDFGSGIIRLNSSGVIAVTVPTLVAMGLAPVAGSLYIAAFEVVGGGIPTFAGKTAATTVNGVAGPIPVNPLFGAPVTYGIYILMQTGNSDDDWSLQ